MFHTSTGEEKTVGDDNDNDKWNASKANANAKSHILFHLIYMPISSGNFISVSIDNGVLFILSLSLFFFFFGANSIIFCSHHVHTQHVLFWNRLPFGRNVLQPFL